MAVAFQMYLLYRAILTVRLCMHSVFIAWTLAGTATTTAL